MAGVGGVSVALLREMVANHLLSTFCTANIYMPVQVLSINTFSRLENSVKKKKKVAPHVWSLLSPFYFYIAYMLAFGLLLNAWHYNAIIVKANVNAARSSSLACFSTVAGLQCLGPKHRCPAWPWRGLQFIRAHVSQIEPPTTLEVLHLHTFRGTSALPALSMDSQWDIILP